MAYKSRQEQRASFEDNSILLDEFAVRASMAEVNEAVSAEMAKYDDPDNVDVSEEDIADEEEEDDGVETINDRRSSYSTGYDYSLLKASEVMITTADVEKFHKKIEGGEGLGTWVNLVFAEERINTLNVVDKARLKEEGKYYHLKSLRKDLEVQELIDFCKSAGIKAIVPTTVEDELFISTHQEELRKNDIWSLACEDAQSYLTLDHKYLSSLFCKEHGIAMAETIPLLANTEDACRDLAEKTMAQGKPCFLKECYDTSSGEGVIKVNKMEDYDNAVERITSGKGSQPADTADKDVHIILQAGNPGIICTGQAIFYKGEMLSGYITRENMELISKLHEYKLAFSIGEWNPTKEDLTFSFKLDLNDPFERKIRDQGIEIMKKAGKAVNYTGMFEVEFIIEESPDAEVNVLEFNPRFSGAAHGYTGSGIVQDYMQLIGLMATTKDDAETITSTMDLGNVRVRSDPHVPQSDLKAYNATKFYMVQLEVMVFLRRMKDVRKKPCKILKMKEKS